MSVLRRIALIVLAVALLTPVAADAFQQQPPDAKQEYVPVDPTVEQERLPAAPLVIGAYSVVWLGVVVYLWSIWQRLSRVERELAQVSRRVQSGGTR